MSLITEYPLCGNMVEYTASHLGVSLPDRQLRQSTTIVAATRKAAWRRSGLVIVSDHSVLASETLDFSCQPADPSSEIAITSKVSRIYDLTTSQRLIQERQTSVPRLAHRHNGGVIRCHQHLHLLPRSRGSASVAGLFWIRQLTS